MRLVGKPSSLPSRTFRLTSNSFDRLTRLLENYSKLYFSTEKQHALEQKLIQRVPLTKRTTPDEFIDILESNPAELQNVVNSLTIGESYFFRNRPHFEALTSHILPALIAANRKNKSLKIWCAGCATGEEPYSLSILIREHFPELGDWNISIIASDINTSFLERAKEGIYTKWSFRGVDDAIIWKYFGKEGENKYRLHSDIKRVVDFRHYNLADICESKYIQADAFDLLMCRNVLIYFSFDSANEIIAKFIDVTSRGSFLIVGHSEAFPALSQFDVVYSNATYYYKYRTGASKVPRQKSFTLGPAPTLSIPGIGVKTIVPKSPKPSSVLDFAPDDKDAAAEPRTNSPKSRSKASVIKDTKHRVNITEELELARTEVNEGKVKETLERLDGLSKGAGKLDYRVHFLKSIVSDQSGHVKESIKSLKQSIFLYKNFVIGHFYLGVIYQREDQIEASVRFFRNAFKLVSELPDDHLLDEAEGLTAGRLREIVEARYSEIKLQQMINKGQL